MKILSLCQTALAMAAFLLPAACSGDKFSECEANRTLYAEGDAVPNDDCNTCACVDGEVACTLIDCGGGAGSCALDGTSYEDGETNIPAADGCNTCACDDGQLACTEIGCQPNPGSGMCVANGVSYPDGKGNIPAPDGCNTCECDDGSLACTERACPEPEVCGTRGAEPCADGFVCDLSATGNCGALDHGGVCVPRPDACDDEYEPVCGCDGESYSNSCDALASGASVASEGECGELNSCKVNGMVVPSGTTNIPAPDGCNTCFCDNGQLGCTKRACPPAERACGGLLGLNCEKSEYCDYEPGDLCGAADALGVCRSILVDVACAQEYEPVCGCDGKTYGNACGAASAGIGILEEGTCEDPPGGMSCLGGDSQLYSDGASNVPDTQSCNTCSCDNGSLTDCTEIFCPTPLLCGGLTGLTCGDSEYCHYEGQAQMCGAADQLGECREIPGACSSDDKPVCGCDGKTHSNACIAASQAVGILHSGKCQ